MFRIKTTVKSLFLFALILPFFFAGFPSQAEESSSKVSPEECRKAAKQYAKDMYPNNNEKYMALYKEKAETCFGGGDRDSCKKSQEEYTSLKGKLEGACSSAGVTPSRTAVSGHVACSSAIEDCLNAKQVEGSIDEDSEALYDTDQMSQQKDLCPALPASLKKQIKEDLKEAKEDIKDLKEKVSELQENKMTNDGSAQDGIIEAQEQLQSAQKECREQQKAIERGLKDQQKEIQNQVQQLNSQILSVNDQIGQMESSIVQAAVDYNKAKTDIELQCHALAITKVQEKRKIILEKVANSVYNHGGFNQAVSASGMPTRKQDQIDAKREYGYCMNDASTKKRLVLARDNYNFAAAAANRQKASYQEQLKQLQQQIGILLNNETARAQTEAAEDQNDMAIACNESIGLAQQRVGQAQMKAVTQVRSTDQRLGEAQRDLELAKEREKNILSAYRLASGGSGSDSGGKDFESVFTAYTSFKSSAENFRFACCTASTVSGMQATCTDAKSFLTAIGVSTSLPVESTAALSSTEQPTASEGDNSSRTPAAGSGTGQSQQQRNRSRVVLPDGRNAPIPEWRPLQQPADGAAAGRR